MHIMHIALGGCLKAPPVQYGMSEDTGGHIAYVIGAALEQARLGGVSRVDIVTRAFADFGPAYLRAEEPLSPRAFIRRLRTDRTEYLTKGALWDELPALTEALVAELAHGPRPDILHAHFADAAEIAFAAGAAYGIPVVYTPHSLALDKEGAALSEPRRVAAERKAIASARAIIVSSRDEAERQVLAYDPAAIGRVHRILPGVPATSTDARPARSLLAGLDRPDLPMILAIARPVAKKNLIGLVHAFARTPELNEHANLVILAGQHDRAGPEARAVIDALRDAGAGCAGRFAMPPAHDTRQVAAIYRLAARTRGVFVNPALFEPFGLTLLEAAQAGLPVVATRHGGPSAILGDLDHGLLVDPADPGDIARACRTLLEDSARWAQASRNAKAGIGRFAWSAYAEESMAVYRSLAPAPRWIAPRPSRLLVCDIDNTLTGCHDGARRFADWVSTAPCPFVVATGRSLPEARAVLRQWNLPEPEAFITSVGTEIFLREGGGLHLWLDYCHRIDEGWDRDAVAAVLEGIAPEWQPSVDQKAHKLSLFGDAQCAERIRCAMELAGLRARVIHSHGRLIDVLPTGAGKARAVAALAGRYGLSLADCIAAGDSGNDFDMLTECGAAIVVGNASDELAALPPRDGLMRVRARSASGVIEGLGQLGLLQANVA
ncbi:HAD-IIB family hydrolase [Cereibacter sp. SYSU M97828]|nr:HAD-IIB family hydrolase [Cereibacter flavus]